MSTEASPWRRAIALVDMNCFYASIEQYDHPHWRKKPVAVTNGKLGSTIITSSYEARAFGVKTGMRLKEARQLCPQLIQAPSRPNRYAALSTKIMASLQTISPDVEIYSVDEAFIDITHCQQLLGTPEHIGELIRATIHKISGLPCSIGVSGDKTTAKFAAKRRKRDGVVVIHPDQSESTLAPYPITELSGVNQGTASFLARYGVINCGDMKQLPISILAQRYGNPGRRIWLMAQGKDPEKVQNNVKPPKTMGHGKNMPPNTYDIHVLLTYFQHMSEKLAARLRMYGFQSKLFYITFKTKARGGWLSSRVEIVHPTNDGKIIFQLCKQFIAQYWGGQGVWQVRVVALELESVQQLELFETVAISNERSQLNQAIDDINQRFGEFTIAPSRLIGRSEMPNVITPAWRPSGHRKTV